MVIATMAMVIVDATMHGGRCSRAHERGAGESSSSKGVHAGNSCQLFHDGAQLAGTATASTLTSNIGYPPHVDVLVQLQRQEEGLPLLAALRLESQACSDAICARPAMMSWVSRIRALAARSRTQHRQCPSKRKQRGAQHHASNYPRQPARVDK